MDLYPAVPHLRPELLAAGFADAELRVLRRTGVVVTVRPGAYVPSPDHRLRDPPARHRLLVGATVARLGPAAAVSHASAAVLHGLPLWSVPLSQVHVTRNRKSGGRRGRLVHVHAAALEADEIVVIDGIAVTSVARTVADLARSESCESSVVTADAALHRGLATHAELVDAVARSVHRRGNTAAARAIAFADGRSESVGESRSRVAIRRCGLPAPTLQWEVRSVSGTLVGRVDFGWPGLGTVGEFDGEVKYGRLVGRGESPGDVAFREKRREDLIRDEGPRVVRWVWDDLARFDAVAVRLRRAFGAA